LFASFATHAQIEQRYKTGFVVTRSILTGENGQPIFAEFDENGDVVEVIGEAVDDLEGAFVLSATAYRFHVAQYDTLVEDFQDTKAKGHRILTREEYDLESFGTVEVPDLADPDAPPQEVAIVKPALAPDTLSVVVRHPQTIATRQIAEKDLVLLQSRINLRARQELDDATRVVLLDREGVIRHQARVNIGYRVALWQPEAGPSPDGRDDDRVARRAGDTPTLRHFCMSASRAPLNMTCRKRSSICAVMMRCSARSWKRSKCPTVSRRT
jgi:hypothetical protein